MKKAYLLIGSNIGDRFYYLTHAASMIQEHCGTILALSSIYETAAWGKTDQPSFLNQVVQIETSLNPSFLLQTILGIEHKLGRERLGKYDARTIDIDILYYGQEVVKTDSLTIPHPKISERRFVLTPMAEIAPDLIDPSIGRSIKLLLDQCKDTLEVKRLINGNIE